MEINADKIENIKGSINAANIQIAEIHLKQAQSEPYSLQYREALQHEIELLDQKKTLLDRLMQENLKSKMSKK